MNVTTVARRLGEAAGESVLVNMKPKSHDAWTGSIYSRSSGNTYCATMTLKSRLQVEACAPGCFWCSGNDWTRVEAPREGAEGWARVVDCCRLDHAEHDGADEGHGEVGGDYAQSPGERHEVAPSTRASLRASVIVNRESRREKVSPAVAQFCRGFGRRAPAWLKIGEINVLKSL